MNSRTKRKTYEVEHSYISNQWGWGLHVRFPKVFGGKRIGYGVMLAIGPFTISVLQEEVDVPKPEEVRRDFPGKIIYGFDHRRGKK